MTFTNTTTGATDRSSIVRGDVALVSGTWNNGGDTASGTLITGGSAILSHGVTVGSAGETGNGDNLDGAIRISSIDASNGVAGDWWAITRLGI